jgi:hypothetical protein
VTRNSQSLSFNIQIADFTEQIQSPKTDLTMTSHHQEGSDRYSAYFVIMSTSQILDGYVMELSPGSQIV